MNWELWWEVNKVDFVIRVGFAVVVVLAWSLAVFFFDRKSRRRDNGGQSEERKG